MKIGILTFHRADNYGAVLQCWALLSSIKRLGFDDVYVIDYLPSYFKEEYRLFPYHRFISGNIRYKLGVIKEFILFYALKKKRHNGFYKFVKKLNLTNMMDENIISFDGFDVIFVGSDQVWNRRLTNGIDKALIGSIKENDQILASYAASTEYNDKIREEDEYYKAVLNNFDYVSSREKLINSYFNTLIPNKSQWVLDPILLVSKEGWEKIAINPKEKGYLLVYTVPMDPSVMELARMIACERKLKIVELVSKVRYVYKKGCRQTISPEEFVGYFYNADYVVTTSFHGTAFSLKMEKQFSTIMLGRPVDERAKDLLVNIGLEDRCVSSKSLHLPTEEIDYNVTNIKLQELVNSSESYITEVINNKIKGHESSI